MLNQYCFCSQSTEGISLVFSIVSPSNQSARTMGSTTRIQAYWGPHEDAVSSFVWGYHGLFHSQAI